MGTVAKLFKIPSPADVPTMTARELVGRIEDQGGRVLRMKVPPSVFVLTDSEALAAWLADRSATSFRSYNRSRGGTHEYDVWIHPIPVLGDETVWEVAARA